MSSTVFILAVSFLLYFACFQAVSSKGVRVPLTIVDTVAGKELRSSQSDGVKNTLTLSGTGFFGWETLQLHVALGTPPQPINVSLDYTSDTIMAFAKGFNETHCKGAMTSRHTFSKTQSSTFSVGNTQMATQYNKPFADVKDCGGLNSTGWSNGSLGIDHLTIGSKTAADVSFYVVEHVQHFNPQWASDGIMGLSYSVDCYMDKDNCTILGFLKAFGDPVVSVYLPRDQLVGQGPPGAITFGSLALPECSSNWSWLSDSLPNIPGWNILVKSFDLGAYHASLKDRPAILFSFAAHIWAPPKVYNKIVATLGAEYSFRDDEYVVECSKVNNRQLPDMSFTLSGTKQVVPAQLYTRPLSTDPKTCVLLVRDSSEYFQPGTDAWIFGTSFLRASCHAFDFKNRRIGFASFA